MAFRTRRYLRDVTSFCSVGRVCGRYVIAVGDMASLLSIIGLVSFTEVHYRTGFALSFWTTITLPISTPGCIKPRCLACQNWWGLNSCFSHKNGLFFGKLQQFIGWEIEYLGMRITL
ncbi:MAG: hypothetical protein IJJ33_15970 [Victivallales bacterium]|nr:hypothetical protein [Victivallales bacterium]